MPTEISQKQISKLAAKLTIPVGGLCLNKFFISKIGLLVTHETDYLIT